MLLGVIGASAVGGAFFLPFLKAKLGPDRVMALGALGQAVAMVLYGIAHEPVTALIASATAGASWIVALATLSVSAQVALPDWVRARGLALYTTVFFGCLTLGSAAWGEVAAAIGLANAHFLASAGAVAAIALTWPWKLQTGATIDLSPSTHWPAPLTAQPIEHDRGPVLVTVEYRINPRDREAFLEALVPLEHERRRDGAYAWVYSKMRPRRAGWSRHSWWNPGWSICASTSASPIPIGWCKNACIGSICQARRK